MKFDLMKEKPELDTPTLNYVWDYLWRKNACNRGENADRRSRALEQQSIMLMLQELANCNESEVS